jgi:predicted Zn-dependent protease
VLLPLTLGIGLILMLTIPTLLFSKDSHIASADQSSSQDHGKKKNNDNKESLSDFIQVCCTWNKELTGGVLTYKIDGANSELKHTVLNAIDHWNANIKHLNLKLVPASSGDANKADIQINFKTKASKIKTDSSASKLSTNDVPLVAGGKSVSSFDNNGFITSVKITLAKTAFGSTLSTRGIEQIALHELGHALGIGHANFKGDLMSPIVNDEKSSISQCDLRAVKQANRLEDIILNSDSRDHILHQVKVYC